MTRPGSTQSKPDAPLAIPRVESLRVANYRSLRSIEFKGLTPFTALLGPNGSGKSTVFDVFNFLSEAFQKGLRSAWDPRGRSKEIKSRGQNGPVVIELRYREKPSAPVITYHLSIDEGPRGPVVEEEWLQWRRGVSGKPFRFLSCKKGEGEAVSGEEPDEVDKRIPVSLRSPDLIAVNSLGQFAEHPRVAALREFITDWYVSYLSVNDARKQPEAGPQERLEKTGENLSNVIQYLQEQHPNRLEEIIQRLRERVPKLEKVVAQPMADGRLLLQIKDAPFEVPIMSKFASDGTLKILAYLVVLHDPNAPKFIGVEEPENFLHPRLLLGLAEECRAASARSQILVTTHSPYFLNGMRPSEVRILYRDEVGFTQTRTVDSIPGIPEFVKEGATLGDLWMEGRFNVGDPLINGGRPRKEGRRS